MAKGLGSRNGTPFPMSGLLPSWSCHPNWCIPFGIICSNLSNPTQMRAATELQRQAGLRLRGGAAVRPCSLEGQGLQGWPGWAPTGGAAQTRAGTKVHGETAQGQRSHSLLGVMGQQTNQLGYGGAQRLTLAKFRNLCFSTASWANGTC